MTSRPETVRIGTESDAESLFFLLVNDLEADNAMGYPVSLKKVSDTILACLKGKGGIAGVIDGPDGIVGSIGIVCAQPWYSERWYLAQMWNFVRPDRRRGTRYGDDLMAFAKWHRADMAVRTSDELELENTVMSTKRLPAKLRYWRRHGTQIGGIFLTGGAHG